MWHRLCSIRTFRRYIAAASESASVETLQDSKPFLRTAVEKVKSLSAAETTTSAELEPLIKHLNEGKCSKSDVFRGLKNNELTMKDIFALEKARALSSIERQHIETTFHRGTSRISVLEVVELLQNRCLGMQDTVHLVQRGDLTFGDLDYLVEKQNLPEDVVSAIKKQIEDSASQPRAFGFSDIRSMLAAQEMRLEKLPGYVLSGQIHPHDVQLLANENLLTSAAAQEVIEKCATDVLHAYEEAEKLAELVGKGRFTFEELEVMRAKGVLGSSIIQYLASRGAIDDAQGQQLLSIDEDPDYLDPEQTDDEAEAFLPKLSYQPPVSEINVSEENENGEASSHSILKTGGLSDEGFFPENIPTRDIFSLWEYLSEVYSNRPGDDIFLSMAQEKTQKQEERKQTTDGPLRRPPPVIAAVDEEGNVTTEGKRKSAVANVQLKKGNGEIFVNGKPFQEYFAHMDGRCYVLSPFLATDTLGQFDVEANVRGGGWSGQAQAVRHGIARALHGFDVEFGTPLQELGLLVRDGRRVERKKPGRAKARKSFQWVKR